MKRKHIYSFKPFFSFFVLLLFSSLVHAETSVVYPNCKDPSLFVERHESYNRLYLSCTTDDQEIVIRRSDNSGTSWQTVTTISGNRLQTSKIISVNGYIILIYAEVGSYPKKMLYTVLNSTGNEIFTKTLDSFYLSAPVYIPDACYDGLNGLHIVYDDDSPRSHYLEVINPTNSDNFLTRYHETFSDAYTASVACNTRVPSDSIIVTYAKNGHIYVRGSIDGGDHFSPEYQIQLPSGVSQATKPVAVLLKESSQNMFNVAISYFSPSNTNSQNSPLCGITAISLYEQGFGNNWTLLSTQKMNYKENCYYPQLFLYNSANNVWNGYSWVNQYTLIGNAINTNNLFKETSEKLFV